MAKKKAAPKKSKPKIKPRKVAKVVAKKKPAPKKPTPPAKKPVASASRSSWLDGESNKPVIDKYARRMSTFVEAMQDGKIDASEVQAQEARLVKAMKETEPLLNADQHDKVTRLLCELCAYDLMQVLHSFEEARPKTVFQG